MRVLHRIGIVMWPDMLGAGSSSLQKAEVGQKVVWLPAASIPVSVEPNVDCIISPSKPLQASDGGAALVIGKSGVLTLRSFADKTVLWSSSAAQAHDAVADADADASTGLFMQVCCALTTAWPRFLAVLCN
jgi:hypothetical protein